MNRARLLMVAALFSFVTGCAYQRHSPEDYSNWPPVSKNETNPVEVGKTVKVNVQDGIVVEGEVDSVSETGFVVSGQHVLFAQVEQVHVRTFLWVPVIVVGSLVTAVGIVVFASPDPGFDY